MRLTVPLPVTAAMNYLRALHINSLCEFNLPYMLARRQTYGIYVCKYLPLDFYPS